MSLYGKDVARPVQAAHLNRNKELLFRDLLALQTLQIFLEHLNSLLELSIAACEKSGVLST